MAATIEARRGGRSDAADLLGLVERYAPLSGPDGWRDVAELAQAAGSDEVWRRAESMVAPVVAAADRRSDLDPAVVATSVRRQLEARRP